MRVLAPLLSSLLTIAICRAFRAYTPSRRIESRHAVSTNFDLGTYLDTKKKIVDSALDKSLVVTDKNVEKIVESMRYSLLAGGKRVRPILCLVRLNSIYTIVYYSNECRDRYHRLHARCLVEMTTWQCQQRWLSR
jgi:hypothetical protein